MLKYCYYFIFLRILPVYPIREDIREIRDKILKVISKINIDKLIT